MIEYEANEGEATTKINGKISKIIIGTLVLVNELKKAFEKRFNKDELKQLEKIYLEGIEAIFENKFYRFVFKTALKNFKNSSLILNIKAKSEERGHEYL